MARGSGRDEGRQLLVPGRVLCLDAVADKWVSVERGALWLTEEGIAIDFCLRAGARHRMRGAGRVVMEAVGAEVCLRVESAPVRGPVAVAGFPEMAQQQDYPAERDEQEYRHRAAEER